VMIYGLAMLAGGPLFARLTDRWQNHAAVVAAGGVVSSALLLLIPFVDGQTAPLAAIVTVAALGIGQAMSIPAQVSMVVGMAAEREVRQGQAPELTVLRFIERFGGGAGPMIAAPLAAHFGADQAIALFGIYGLASALLYAVVAVRPVRAGAAP
jgi:predicted MFS family arabinose efflux permease